MNFVEIGVFDGKSLSYLVQNILKTQTNVNFYAVDKWINDIDFNRFILNMKECGIKDYINIIREESIVASKKFKDEFFDFIFIDASHSYNDVKNDIISWMPKLKKGGIIAGDDYDIGWPEVIRAVNDILINRTINKSVWYYYK
jgi:predicted O-methyltransferase YrrM